MADPLDFPTLLHLIEERSEVFRATIAAAPDLGAQVPTCPEWTLLDLVEHLGQGQRRWAAVVAFGPSGTRPAEADAAGAAVAPREREALLSWWTASTEDLLAALRETGPDRACWTWWEGSQSPQTSGAVARHRVQEISVHTYDAQVTVGAPQPLPEQVGLDGVDEFVSTCNAGPYAWPYEPAVVQYVATEGAAWQVRLAADGVRADSSATPSGTSDATLTGTAGELVLFVYGRIPMDRLKGDGDLHVFDLLAAWDPDA